MIVGFPPFRIDLDEERLWKGATQLTLRRKPFAILRYLVANPKRLVTHDELLEHVWGGTAVSESAVRSHLHELRQVLGEGVIETVIGRGYRFTAEVTEAQLRTPIRSTESVAVPSRLIVGRDAELAVLRAAFARAETGHRQLCFITGEPGIGKTTVVDAFLDELQRRQVLAVRGQCVEQHGTPESYLAVIEILGALRRSARGEAVADALVRYAPTFAAQVPHLIHNSQIEEVTRRARGGTDAKMVRELIEALEALSEQQPLVVVLEDLQWSDLATIDMISYIGQRKELARLLVIGTSRRADAQNVAHPLNRVMRSLVARAGATAIPLDRIAVADVQKFIDLRFPGHVFPMEMLATVAKITDGTPLFMVSLLDDLIARGMLVEQDGQWTLTASTSDVAAHRPDSVTQLIDIQIDRLTPEEQRLLEAASAIGLIFSSSLVAAALDRPVEEVDDHCEDLIRRGLFLRHDGTEEWPDENVHSRYAMTHGLVQEVCIGRGAPVRRQRWHKLIAERLETAYGERVTEISHVLATHLDKAGLAARAIHYYALAARRTAVRLASSDAHTLYRRALDLLSRIPDGAARDATELGLLQGASTAVVRQTPSTSDPLQLFERMVALARRVGDKVSLCSALLNMSVRLSTLAQYQRALDVIAQVDAVGLEMPPGSPMRIFLDSVRAMALFWTGQLAASFEHLEAHTLPEPPSEDGVQLLLLAPTDRRVVFIVYISGLCWLLGSPERAFREAQRAMEIAEASGDPYTRAISYCHQARLRVFVGDPPGEVRAYAQAALAIDDAEVWHAQARLLVRWADSHDAPLDAAAIDGTLHDLHDRVALFPMGWTYLGITSIGALRRSGRDAEAMAVVDEMLEFARTRDERFLEPELQRIRGELLEPTDVEAAAVAYEEAWTNARAMGSRALELRAAVRLATVRRGTASSAGMLDRLATVAALFTDGRNTADLTAARALLASAPT